METCYVLFGSNIGDKEKIFGEVCKLINNRCGNIVAVSSSYESEPWGFDAEEWFLNRLIVMETEMEPEALLRELLKIEAELGRVRQHDAGGYVSRTADLDILYYGHRIVATSSLIVPHPRLHFRRFALLPLCEMAPQLMHPVLQVTQSDLLKQCTDDTIVRVKEQVS